MRTGRPRDPNAWIIKTCLHCRREFEARRCYVSRGQMDCCSKECENARRRRTAEVIFWENIIIPINEEECWLWDGTRTPQNYGVVSTYCEGKVTRVSAHRMAWKMFRGENPPPQLDICHHCDNPPCANPYHLFKGTHQENMLDAKTKGRAYTPEQMQKTSAVAVANRRAKTHCKHGHPLDELNTKWYQGSRRCKECRISVYPRSKYPPTGAKQCTM